MKFKLSLLISFLFMGIVYGLSYHYVVMPVFGSELIHCVISGIIIAFITYFVIIRILYRFSKLKEINRKLEKNIAIDELTGLHNRRAFDNDIMKIQKDTTYSSIFIDIDNFRRFNVSA